MAHSTRPNLQLFIDRLTRRSVLTREEQQAVLDLPGEAAQVQTNRDFVRPAERVDHACLIVAGMVGRFDQNAEGKRQITAIYIPGDMADLQSVVQPDPSWALQALWTATILRIPHLAIRAAAARYPALAEAFWRDSMVDSATLAQWVVNVGRRDAKKRVVHLLCELATRIGVVPKNDDVELGLPINQAQLADATALTPVHVNRTLQSLRADGLLQWHRGVLRIPNWTAFVAAGEFDSRYLQMHIRPEERLRIVQAA